MDVSDIKDAIAAYLGRSSAADLNPSTLTPAGPNIDLGLVALNNARRTAERAHDFRFSELDVLISIPSPGALLTTAYVTTGVTVNGTGSPSADGTYVFAGIFNGVPFYNLPTTDFFLYFLNTYWALTETITPSPSDLWILNTTSPSPDGLYAPSGFVYTGTPTVTNSTDFISIKRVKFVSLPCAGSDYQPIEFAAKDQYEARVRSLNGRTTFLPGANVPALGYPMAYQNGQSIFLAPNSASLPIVAQLNVVAWLPDYATNGDTDFFTDFGSDYLQWAGILEVNKLFRRFAPKQEGNIDEPSIQAEADQALQSFIAWDNSVTKGSNEYGLPPFQSFEAFEAPQPAPAQSAPPKP